MCMGVQVYMCACALACANVYVIVQRTHAVTEYCIQIMDAAPNALDNMHSAVCRVMCSKATLCRWFECGLSGGGWGAAWVVAGVDVELVGGGHEVWLGRGS